MSGVGGGIYGYQGPGRGSVVGRLIASLAGVALGSALATNILTYSWGPPAAGQPLVSSGLSRLVSAGALLACVAAVLRTRRLRALGASGVAVIALLALTPLYHPYTFWHVATKGVQGLLTPAAGLRVVLAAVVGAAVAGAFMYNVVKLLRLRSASAKGSAWWGEGRALKAAKQGLLLGRHDDRLLRYNGAGHLMTVAATRSGKGVGSIIPNLLSFPGSVVVTDPKGENYYVTARYRREELGHEVVAMDPFGITLASSSGFNPLDLIDLAGDDYVETAMMLAEMIVVRKAGANTEPHWVMEGKALLYAFILHAASLEDTEKRNLIEVRRMLTLEREGMAKLLDAMSTSPIAQVREGVARLEQKAERELSGVMSTVQSFTHFLSSPRMERVLTRTDFSLSGMVEDRLSLYLVLPMEHLTAFAPWLRLMITCAYYVCTHQVINRRPTEHRILFLLDEFANLGYMSNLKSALSLGGGYGVSMWLILQDFGQLKQAYTTEWESFVANSDVLQCFAIQDTFSAKTVSDMLGMTTVWQRQTRQRSRKEGGELVRDYIEDSRPLLRPGELRRLHPDRALLLVRPYQPVAATKIRYYQDPLFAGRWDDNPYVVS